MKKGILCSLFCCFVLMVPIYGSDNVHLEDMTVQELRLYRNLQYARHGYRFNSQDLQDYFSQFEWYNPNESNEGIKLTNEEDKIVTECLKLEKAKSQNITEKYYLNNIFKDEAFKKDTFTNNKETYIFAYNEIGNVRDVVNYDKLVITNKAVIYKVINNQVKPLLIIDENKIYTNEKLLTEIKMPQEFYGWHIKVNDKNLKVYAQPFADNGKNTTESIDFKLNEKGDFEKINYQELYKDLY